MNKLKSQIILLFLVIGIFQADYSFAQDSWKNCFKNKKGTIRVYCMNNSNFLFEKNGMLAGIEYEIIEEFKRYIEEVYGVLLTIKYKRSRTFSEIYQNIKNGKTGEFGACSFSITEQRMKEVSFSPPYMPDIEVMITSDNIPLFKDTLDFLNYAEQAKFLIVPNTTYEEDFLSLKNLGFVGEKEIIVDGKIIHDRIQNENDLISFTELTNYLLSLKKGEKLKRQNVFKFERKGYGIIFPKNSDWTDVIDLFFREEQTIDKINLLLIKYLGDDVQDLLMKVEYNYQDEVLLLRKEREVQQLKIKNQELNEQKNENEFNAAQNINERTNLFLMIGLFFVAAFLIVILVAFRNQTKSKRIIEEQNTKLEDSNEKLGKSYKEIEDSILYAQRLQQAILPTKEDLNKILGEGFILFKPKDAVSGDFYWMQVIDDTVLYAVGDCTGHGVPGAMVSVVCFNALNRSVKEFGLKSPAKILNKTRELVIETFGKNGEEIKDGMDIALVSYKKNKCVFAGAYNPLWIVRDKKWETISDDNCKVTEEFGRLIIEYYPNKLPVGKHILMDDFSECEIELRPEDRLYIFSDGYADQFGGEHEKKFKHKRIKSLLAESFLIGMDAQKELLDSTLKNWMGDIEQIDDITIMGVRVGH